MSSSGWWYVTCVCLAWSGVYVTCVCLAWSGVYVTCVCLAWSGVYVTCVSYLVWCVCGQMSDCVGRHQKQVEAAVTGRDRTTYGHSTPT